MRISAPFGWLPCISHVSHFLPEITRKVSDFYRRHQKEIEIYSLEAAILWFAGVKVSKIFLTIVTGLGYMLGFNEGPTLPEDLLERYVRKTEDRHCYTNEGVKSLVLACRVMSMQIVRERFSLFNESRHLCIIGQSGVGKTEFMFNIANEMHSQGAIVYNLKREELQRRQISFYSGNSAFAEIRNFLNGIQEKENKPVFLLMDELEDTQMGNSAAIHFLKKSEELRFSIIATMEHSPEDMLGTWKHLDRRISTIALKALDLQGIFEVECAIKQKYTQKNRVNLDDTVIRKTVEWVKKYSAEEDDSKCHTRASQLLQWCCSGKGNEPGVKVTEKDVFQELRMTDWYQKMLVKLFVEKAGQQSASSLIEYAVKRAVLSTQDNLEETFKKCCETGLTRDIIDEYFPFSSSDTTIKPPE